MDREKLTNCEKILKIYFIDDSEATVDVNNDDDWEKILRNKQRIFKIVSQEWTWNVLTGEIIIH
jgi:hypothetical protein